MQPKLLELHFSQLKTEWSISKYNIYSDKRKQDYHANLEKIIVGLEGENFEALNDTQIRERFFIIFFVFKSLEFLNHSTTSTIPFEMVYVLETALKDWSPTDEYLIVTSLVNGMNNFSFDSSLTFSDFIYRYIEILYKVTFSHRLVQINMPESISRDYLANVVLYHELGHFIEKKYEITRVIYQELLNVMLSSGPHVNKDNIIKFFPYLDNPANVRFLKAEYKAYNIFAMHISEYFCDLFASQYIGDCSNFYLEYITLNQSQWSETHPATTNRVVFINEYLDNKDGFVLSEYKRVVQKITGQSIGYKAKEFSTSNFESLIPVNINDQKELHTLFVYGWKVWMQEWQNISKRADIKFQLSNANVYAIINNLIEKSIGNYIVKTEWELTKL